MGKKSRVNLKWLLHGLLKHCPHLLGYILKANQEQSKKSCTEERRWSRRRKRIKRKEPTQGECKMSSELCREVKVKQTQKKHL